MATLAPPSQRPAASSSFPSRASGVARRRVVAIILIVVSLALLSVYFRESSGGPLHSLQSVGASILHPFEVAANRVATPFRDAVNWFSGLIDAKSNAEKLRKENEVLRQQVIQRQNAVADNQQLRKLIAYAEGPTFPHDYRPLAARVIVRPTDRGVQQVIISAGSNAGIKLHDPVVTADGLVGQVTKVVKAQAQVTLLTDPEAAASGLDLKTRASGIVEHGPSDSLAFDRVKKERVINQGDTIVTAGWQSGDLADIYPKGIAIGTVTSASQNSTDIYKHVQIEPFVDFGALETVLVLISTKER